MVGFCGQPEPPDGERSVTRDEWSRTWTPDEGFTATPARVFLQVPGRATLDVVSLYGIDAPLAVAHRGGAGLAPENTLAAFRRSLALGVRYLETDVRLTADGVCVAFHDAGLRRATGVRGRVDAISWRDLRAIRVQGERIPRLTELLEAFPDARFTIDVKDPRALDPLIDDLRAARAVERVCLAGAPDRVLEEARQRLGPGLSTALGVESLTRLALAARAGARPWGIPGAQFAHVPLRLGRLPVFAERVLRAAHALGLRVLVWTVDDPALMHRLLDQGADGVITDRPDLLREVMLARGSWRPVGRADPAVELPQS